LDEIESAKANECMLGGKCADDPVDLRPQGHGRFCGDDSPKRGVIFNILPLYVLSFLMLLATAQS